MMLSTIVETSNPTHMVGLLMNRISHYPLKRDVCQRGLFQIADVLRLISGFTPKEMEDIGRDLREKGLPVSMRGIKRKLFDAGRI